MAEADDDAKQVPPKASILETALTRIREAQADRDDVVVELRLAARGRLEILARDLVPLFNELPEVNEQFEFALTDGEDPRLWIDMTSFVRMGRDRRTYEFVKDTRIGRTLLAQTNDRAEVVRRVAEYVAERVLERERALEGDWMALRHYDFDTGKFRRKPRPTGMGGIAREATVWKTVAIFMFGLFVGAGGFFAWAWLATAAG